MNMERKLRTSLAVTVVVAMGALLELVPRQAVTAAPSDVAIQPGAPLYAPPDAPHWAIPEGPVATALHLHVCTMNFVFTDVGVPRPASARGRGPAPKRSTYIGVAGHCARPDARVSAPRIREFGTTVFWRSCRVHADTCAPGSPIEDDFALIRIDDDKLHLVSPVMRGLGRAPSGFTTSAETATGDGVITHGFGIPFSTVEAARTFESVLVADDERHYEVPMASTTHSGSPVALTDSGKALGIVAARYTSGTMVGGPTVEYILRGLSKAGFDVALVTK